MGCDIHVHVEVKIAGRWEHYNHPNVRANYSLFSKMAGVRADRDDDDPIAKPRGIPDDATATTKFDVARMGVDGHSHSWLSIAEMATLSRWWEVSNF